MKLWSKENTQTSERIERFTVGRDPEFDMLLAAHDVEGPLGQPAAPRLEPPHAPLRARIRRAIR